MLLVYHTVFRMHWVTVFAYVSSIFACQLHIRIEKFKNTKVVIRGRNAKWGRQYNGKKKKNKRTNNDLQNTTQKTKDRPTQTPAKKSAVNLRAPEVICSSFSAFWHP